MLHAACGAPLCAAQLLRAPRAQSRPARPRIVAAAASPPSQPPPSPPPPPSHAVSRRAALLSLTAACAATVAASPPPAFAAAAPAPAPPPAVASLAPFTARCGATLLLPDGWVTASDRENAGKGALTLNLVGDFNSVDTVSLRRELLPEGGAAWLDGSLPAADVAARLTAPERAAVAAGEATGAVAGVVNGSSGVLSFDVLSSAQRPPRAGAPPGARPYYSVETRSEQCRGLVQEGKGGALVCTHARFRAHSG
jgi:hypothetical protein